MQTEISRIRRYLRTQTVIVRWMTEHSGYTMPDLDTIYVNPAWEIARILVHETYHSLHPDWAEVRVEAAAVALVDGLSSRQVLELAKLCDGMTWTRKERKDDVA